MRRRSRLCLAVVGVMLVGVSFAAAMPSSSARSEGSTGMSSSAQTESDSPEAVIAQLVAVGASDPTFSDATLDDDNNGYYVYTTLPVDDQHRSAYEAATGGAPLQFKSAILTQSAVAQITDLLRSERDSLAALGFDVVQFGLDDFGSIYRITYKGSADGPPQSLVDAINAITRTGVEYTRGDVVGFARARYTDEPPYQGGAEISGTVDNNLVQDQCTSGFAMENLNTGDYELLTAWHCSNVTLSQSQDRFFTSWNNTQHTIGNVAVRNPAHDALFVRVFSPNESRGYVFTGAHGSGTLDHTVDGTGNMVSNEIVCLSGAAIGANCSVKTGPVTDWVVANDYDQSRNSPDITGRKVTSTNNSIIASSGDSGGPVYKYSNGKLNARGIISAAPNGSIEYDCPDYIPQGEPCSKTMLIVPMSSILADNSPILLIG
jgi:hypothetical protein